MCVYIYVYIYIYVCVCVYVYIYICMCVYIGTLDIESIQGSAGGECCRAQVQTGLSFASIVGLFRLYSRSLLPL
jgi:hypothetical protein